MLSLLLVSLLGLSARSYAFLPECASSCVGEAIDGTLCSSADTRCICESKNFQLSLNSCIEFNCDDEEQEDALARAEQYCAAALPHSGLRARDAEPEANYGPPQYGQPAKPPHYQPKPPAYHPKPPQYGGNKHHHQKCKNHKHPYWSRGQKKCVKKCKSGHYTKNKECIPTDKKHHHPKCKHSPHPYYSHSSKKCVKQCKPGHYLKNKACHPHKPTKTYKPHKPTTLHTKTKTPTKYPTPTTHKPHTTTTCTTTTHTATRYTPTVVPTVY